jgi:predicted metal-dependent hydrolase
VRNPDLDVLRAEIQQAHANNVKAETNLIFSFLELARADYERGEKAVADRNLKNALRSLEEANRRLHRVDSENIRTALGSKLLEASSAIQRFPERSSTAGVGC